MAQTETVELYLSGLRNAHALENEALAIMSRQVERLESYPDIKIRLQEHIRETENQQKRLQEILDRFDEGTSSIKDMGGSIMGSLAAMGHTVAGDEVLKNTFANYAFENFEIAAYKSLITLSDVLGRSSDSKLLEQTLSEELAMASWIEENVEAVTLKFVKLKEAGAEAKV